MVRRVLIGATLAFFLLSGTSAEAAFLHRSDARKALADYLGEPLDGGHYSVRRCDRHSATVLICRYTVEQPTPTPEGVTFTYNGIAYIRIRHGRVVVRDPMLATYTPRAPILTPIDAIGSIWR